uniref:AIG1-type G domain-containing protein n=1 Tax=Astatotilapia calliptera TaxID=8154 RepID=A0A3P8P6I2_ASTCA
IYYLLLLLVYYCPAGAGKAEEEELRIVLVGKTGVGKTSSAAGNTILGRPAFKSTSSAGSVTSECEKVSGDFEGQTLFIVDTPGLFDTKDQEKVVGEVMNCIMYCAPGPHVFLIVIQAGRFTSEEQETVKMIQKIFGEKAAGYTIALFTRGDDLEADNITVEKFICDNQALCGFMSQCGGGYHVFNNRSKDPSQVKQLLEKIDTMVQRNGGSYYTSEMLKEAERAITEEIHYLQKDDPNLTDKDARKQALKNPYFKTSSIRKSVTSCLMSLCKVIYDLNCCR